MQIIDAHSHIDYITHNFQDSVVGTVVCTTQESEWNILENLMRGDKNIFGAFGIHPWFADSVENGFEPRLENLLKNNSSYMVGEIGLDKYKPDIERQIYVFQKQFDIAVKLNRIIFIHCVGAWDKILHILKQYKKSDLPIIVFHGFNASDDVLNNLLSNYDNVMFSIPKNAVYSENSRIERIDINKILIETDGKSNVILKDVIDKITQIQHNDDIHDIIYNNTRKVLHNG